MKHLLNALPTLAVTLILVIIGLAILRPDLIPMPSFLESTESEESLKAERLGEAVALIDDGWSSSPRYRKGPRELPVIRLSSPEIASRIGLQTGIAELTEITDTVIGNAETEFNANRYAEIFPRVRGIIREIRGEEGLDCKPGDLLAVVDSAEVGSAKADYLAAIPAYELADETLKRTTALVAKDAAPRSTEFSDRAALNRARADLLNAEQRLRNFGFNDADLVRIAKSQETSSLLKIVAPIHGKVVDRHAVVGEAVEPNSRMFIVADTTEMWAWVDLDESQFDRVQPGQAVQFTIPGMPGSVFRGAVEWIDPAVNVSTRTVRVRISLQNPESKLRAKQFGTASIEIGTPRKAVLVPREAVQEFDEEAALVFLPDGTDRYRPQRVAVRRSARPGMLEVEWGLKGGESIVTTGSFPLLSELKREEIGGE